MDFIFHGHSNSISKPPFLKGLQFSLKMWIPQFLFYFLFSFLFLSFSLSLSPPSFYRQPPTTICLSSLDLRQTQLHSVSSFNKATSPPLENTFSQCAMDAHALQSLLYLSWRLTMPNIEAHWWSKHYILASTSSRRSSSLPYPPLEATLRSSPAWRRAPSLPPRYLPTRANSGALVLPIGPQAHGPTGGDRFGHRCEGERGRYDGAGVGELVGRHSGGRGDGHARWCRGEGGGRRYRDSMPL